MAIFEEPFNKGTEREGQFDLAISDHTMALEMDPGNALAYYSRGVAYGRKGQWEQAFSDFTKTLEIDPENAGAWYSKGDALKNLGKYHDAIRIYDNFVKYASPEFAEDVKEIKRVVQDLKNRIARIYGEAPSC